jgi:hypothetical protein
MLDYDVRIHPHSADYIVGAIIATIVLLPRRIDDILLL